MTDTPTRKRCRHERNSWLIGDAYYEWCYVCGAIRCLGRKKPNVCYPTSPWAVPTGDRDNNPYEKWDKKKKLK